MSKILPAGEHNGTIVCSWCSTRLFVCRIGYCADTTYDEHGNERASVILVEKGCCSKRIGHRTVDLSRGSLLFIPARHLQSDSFPVSTTFVAAEFSPSFLEGFNEFDFGNMEHVQLAQRDAQDFGARPLRELVQPDAVSGMVFEGILLNLLVYAQRGRERRYRKPPSWLVPAKELLHDRAFESLRLHEIARAADIHPAQLSREFRCFFKVTPGEYLRQLRIDYARTKMAQTDLSLADVAVESGFADQAHFSKVFRQRMSLSPGQYRDLVKPVSCTGKA